jgi:hypothetical protein
MLTSYKENGQRYKWRVHPESNRGLMVLQTYALPTWLWTQRFLTQLETLLPLDQVLRPVDVEDGSLKLASRSFWVPPGGLGRLDETEPVRNKVPLLEDGQDDLQWKTMRVHQPEEADDLSAIFGFSYNLKRGPCPSGDVP